MASIALFSVFLVTSHLMLHSLAQEQSGDTSCDPFLCGKLREVRFPYKNRTMQSACGFYTVDCENSQHPKIQFKEGGHWFEVLNISQAGTVTVNDTELQKELDSRKCKSLESFGLPAPLWYTNVSSPKIVSLFKCNRTSLPINITSPTSDFHNTTCGDYNLYYSTPTDQPFNITSFSNNIPKDCSFIQLPAADNRNAPNPNDFFSFFSSNFLLEVHIDYVCLECQRQNSSCHYDSEKKQNYCAPEPPKAPIEPTAPKGNRSFFAKNRRTVSIAAACAGLIVLVVLLCCLIRKFSLNKYIFFWKKPNEAHQNVEALLRMHGPLPTGRYSYLDVKKMTKSFTSKIGQGGYGSVYKGKLQNGCSVAVKVLNKSKGNGEEFINEVATIGRTSHVNIVALLGFCFEGSKRALIYEFMPNGSLEKFIFKESHNLEESHQLEWGTLYGISLGIARGLEYLHRGCNTRILHFDIKPHNILLDKDFSPKISDFGLAKVCTREESIVSMLEARGTVGYIAPEVFCRSFGGVSPKSDVYSYGMMVLEMVGGRNNVSDGADRTSEIYFPHWIYKRLELDDELGLKRIPNEEDNTKVRKMVITGLWCIQTDPSKRPTMSKVIEMLEGSVDSLQVPPKPFLSSPPRSPTDSSNSLLHAWIHGSNVAST